MPVDRVEIRVFTTEAALSADEEEVRSVLGATMDALLELGAVVDLYQGDVKDELGARAARLVADMLHQAGKYLTHGYGEINEVLLEARQRGWLEPIDG